MAQISKTYTVLLARFQYTGPTNADHLLFTAPTTDTIVLRDVILTNFSTVLDGVFQLYDTAGDPAVFYVYQQLAKGSSLHLELRQVLRPSASLRLFAGTDNLTAVVTGYRLSSPT